MFPYTVEENEFLSKTKRAANEVGKVNANVKSHIVATTTEAIGHGKGYVHPMFQELYNTYATFWLATLASLKR
jgi:hypothetical protein